MTINVKDTFDSLNNDINLYKDGLELIEGVLELYKTFFDLRDKDGRDKYFIIDCGVNIIEKYKKQWIDLFDNILIFRNSKCDFDIKDIKVDEFHYIIHGMEKFFLKEYGLFLSSWDLEVATFIEKNNSAKNSKFYMIEQSKEQIKNFNLNTIKEIIESVRKEASGELNNIIKAFNRSISIEKDDLRYFIINETSIDLNIFYDELNFMREAVLRKFDDLQEKIKLLIEEKLVKKTLGDINKVTEEKFAVIIRKYKNELNKCYILTIDLMENPMVCCNKNKLITNESLYRRCGAVLEVEINYLQFVRAIGVECLRILEKEAEAVFNNVFNCEFYSGIPDVKFSVDLKNLIEAYKTKSDFILKNLVMGLLKEFINTYHEEILLMLKNRKARIEKLYVFKPITYMGQFHIYEPSVVVHLQRYLSDIYDYYDLKGSKNQELYEIKRTYIGLNEEVKKAVDSFNSSLESIQIEEYKEDSFQSEKVMIHRYTTALKAELWMALNSRYITVFNSFNTMVRRTIEHLQGEMKAFENNIDYSDY